MFVHFVKNIGEHPQAMQKSSGSDIISQSSRVIIVRTSNLIALVLLYIMRFWSLECFIFFFIFRSNFRLFCSIIFFPESNFVLCLENLKNENKMREKNPIKMKFSFLTRFQISRKIKLQFEMERDLNYEKKRKEFQF